jgi:hypothetical protein
MRIGQDIKIQVLELKRAKLINMKINLVII